MGMKKLRYSQFLPVGERRGQILKVPTITSIKICTEAEFFKRGYQVLFFTPHVSLGGVGGYKVPTR